MLYDPRNEAIRKFLASLQGRMRSYLDQFGSLDLSVRPFEMVSGGEVVYLDRDRERSLAFRLYRDGVRRLVVHPDVSWDNLLRLLELLSLRATGAASSEEDAVTLLRKADITAIELEAVEGFVPDEEQPEEDPGGRRVSAGTTTHVEAPRDWDQPLPSIAPPAITTYREISPDALAALREESSPFVLPDLALRLVSSLFRVVADPTDPTSIEDLRGLLQETRDTMLILEDLSRLSRLFWLVADAPYPIHGAELALQLFTEPGVLARVVRLVVAAGGDPVLESGLLEAAAEQTVAELLQLCQELLRRARADNVEPPGLALARALLGRLCEARPELLQSWLEQGDADMVRLLLPMLERLDTARTYAALLALVNSPDPEVQKPVLETLARLNLSPEQALDLVPLLGWANHRVRDTAVSLLGRVGDETTLARLVSLIEERAAFDLSPSEAEAIGRAIALMAPQSAKNAFREWIHPRALLRRLVHMPSHRMKVWAAVAGLGELPGDDVEAMIREGLSGAEEDLRRHIFQTLTRRLRRGGQP